MLMCTVRPYQHIKCLRCDYMVISVVAIGPVIFCTFLLLCFLVIVNKSHKKTKINNEILRISSVYMLLLCTTDLHCSPKTTWALTVY